MPNTTQQPENSYLLMVSGIFIAIFIIGLIIFLDPDTAQLGQIGPFIGGMSLFFGAVGAWITAYKVTARNAAIERQQRQAASEREEQRRKDESEREEAHKARELYIRAVDSFRILYTEFWKAEDISHARRWIISKKEYETTLKPVLEKRHKTELNELDADDNEILEILDRFLSILVRIKSFSHSGEIEVIEEWQRQLWQKILHGEFWSRFIYENRNPELYGYLYKHWKDELLSPDAPSPKYDEAKMELQL